MADKIDIIEVKKEKKLFDYKEWYKKNKGKLSKSRKSKYQNDEEYKSKAKIVSKTSYWNRKVGKEETERKALPLLSDYEVYKEIEVLVSNPNDKRCGQTIKVPCFTTHELSDCLGRSEQSYRLWIRKGIMPECKWTDAKFRLVTKDQAEMIIGKRDLMNIPYLKQDDWIFSKEVKKAWKDMPDGIRVEK